MSGTSLFRGDFDVEKHTGRAVNFLGDADSTGSMTGQLAGAFYGFDTIDPALLWNMHEWDKTASIAVRAVLLSENGPTSV